MRHTREGERENLLRIDKIFSFRTFYEIHISHRDVRLDTVGRLSPDHLRRWLIKIRYHLIGDVTHVVRGKHHKNGIFKLYGIFLIGFSTLRPDLILFNA